MRDNDNRLSMEKGAPDKGGEGLGPGLLGEIEAILARLVSFDTTSHKSNLALVGYIETLLKAQGVDYELIPDETGEKAAIYATIGPVDAGGGIGLSGHTDVVPVTGQAWDTDPFKLTRKGTRLYGRGTTDMKGFLAVMLAGLPAFCEANLKRPLHLIFSYDEEIGCTGVRPLIARLGKNLPKPAFVIVGEPSTSELVSAHKGILSYETEVSGHEAHSSVLHRGVSAIEVAAKLIGFLTDQQAKLQDGPLDERFDPPYTTVHIGQIQGGTARNIVAKSCRFGWEVRSLPGFDGDVIETAFAAYSQEELLPAMQAISHDCAIETRRLGAVPGFAASESAVTLGLKLSRQNHDLAVSYGTEAGLFEGGGVPSVICGPGHIHQAHKPNEFIEEDELIKSTRLIRAVLEDLSSSAGGL